MYDTLMRETTPECPIVSLIAQRIDRIPIYISQEASGHGGILRHGVWIQAWWVRAGWLRVPPRVTARNRFDDQKNEGISQKLPKTAQESTLQAPRLRMTKGGSDPSRESSGILTMEGCVRRARARTFSAVYVCAVPFILRAIRMASETDPV